MFRLQELSRYIFLTHAPIVTLVHQFVYPNVPDSRLAELRNAFE
jgi:hypothetical protein